MLWAATALALPPSTPAPIGLVGAPDSPAPQIVGGTPTDGYDAVAALARPDGSGGYDVFCTATLVHPSHLITAAHCVPGLPDGLAVVVFGDAAGESPDQVIDIADVRFHPGYQPLDYLNDVAVVELALPASAPRVALNDEPPDAGWLGLELRFVGFGKPSDEAAPDGLKRVTDIPIVDLDPQLLFTDDPERNVCQGDSGGPAFERTSAGLELAAISAFTIDGCLGGGSGSTRIDPQLGWLLDVIPDLVLDASELPESDVDTDVDTDSDADSDADTDWGAPTGPTPGTYDTALGCTQAPVPWGPVGALVFATLFLARRGSSA